MSYLLFWLFSALTLGFAVAVVVNRNPVASALSLVVSFAGLTALFVMLDAYFLGIVQVLVYAGAVMVLFLFIVMLLDLKAEKARKVNLPVLAGGAAVALIFVAQLAAVIDRFTVGRHAFPPLTAALTDSQNIGTTLFSGFNLPFQVVGVLILVASIGVVVLSKRELK